MIIVSSSTTNNYENQRLRNHAFPVQTDQILYRFKRDGTINAFYKNGVDIIQRAVEIADGSNIGVLLRYSNNNDSFFAKVANALGWITDRPPDNYTTQGMAKSLSELKKHMNHGNRIDWYVSMSRSSLIGNMQKIEFPIVYKPSNGRHGEGILLINNERELLNIDHNWNIPMLLQEFLDKKFEYRVICYDGEVINFARKMLKTKSGNQFGGRRFEARDRLLDDYVNYIRRYAKPGLVGIDICRTRGDGSIIYIIEENRAPEFESLDRATGSNTAQLIIEYMERTINND